jgi:hypothetical protein
LRRRVPFAPDARTLANVELLILETSAGWLDVQRAPPDDLESMKRAAGRALDLADLEELKAIKRLRG